MEFNYSEQALIRKAKMAEAQAKELRKSAESSRHARAEAIRKRDAEKERIMLAAEKQNQIHRDAKADFDRRMARFVSVIVQELTTQGLRISVAPTISGLGMRDMFTVCDLRSSNAARVKAGESGSIKAS